MIDNVKKEDIPEYILMRIKEKVKNYKNIRSFKRKQFYHDSNFEIYAKLMIEFNKLTNLMDQKYYTPEELRKVLYDIIIQCFLGLESPFVNSNFTSK